MCLDGRRVVDTQFLEGVADEVIQFQSPNRRMVDIEDSASKIIGGERSVGEIGGIENVVRSLTVVFRGFFCRLFVC